jgi:hypothetical protein
MDSVNNIDPSTTHLFMGVTIHRIIAIIKPQFEEKYGGWMSNSQFITCEPSVTHAQRIKHEFVLKRITIHQITESNGPRLQ